jgi:hypothetical protein
MDDDLDSVQGSPEEPFVATQSMSEPTPATDVLPSMMVPIKTVSQPQDLESLRQRIALKILDILMTGLKQPDIALLSNTVVILDRIWEDDRPHLLHVYGKELDDYRGHLDRWSKCIMGLVTFCELTGFLGNETTRDGFLTGAFEEVPAEALRAFLLARSSIANWGCGSALSDDARAVASILYHSASWAGMMKLTQMEVLTLRFNRELHSWFSSVGL